MQESKLVRNSLKDIAPNNSDRAVRAGTIQPNADTKVQKLAPLVKKGNVAKKKRTLLDKFKESFLGESENLGDYIIHDVLIPAFRDTISDMGIGVIERMFGNGRTRQMGRSSITRDRGRSYVTYNNSDRGRGRDDRRDDRDRDRGRGRHNFENVVFTNKWEAEDVLSHLVDMTLEYGEATVRAFYELSNMDSEHTDENYGWTNLRDAYVDRTRDGFIIAFPTPRPL